MKKFILMAIATVLLVNFSFANPNTNKVKSNKVINVIKRQMQYPSFIKDLKVGDYVTVIVGVEENGRIKVDEIYSQNSELQAYVLKKLESIVIQNFKSNETYSMKIVFKNEKI